MSHDKGTPYRGRQQDDRQHDDRHDDDRQRSFAEAWQRHASRPPALAPEDAAGQVLRRLAERGGEGSGRDRRRPLRPATAIALAALLLAVAVVALRLTDLRSDPSAPPRAGEVGAVGASPTEDVLVLWLDEETPLYLTLQPPADGGDPHKETL